MVFASITVSFVGFFLYEADGFMGYTQSASLYAKICDTIEHFDWYTYPNELQKILLVAMIEAQQPVEFRCFESKSANRDTFKKVSLNEKCAKNTNLFQVIHTAYLYFMIRRGFSQ